MKTKLVTLLLCLFLLTVIFGMIACLAPAPSNPQTSTDEGGTETNATIMAVYEQATSLGYEGTATKIKIADTYNNLPVKVIYEKAFYNNYNITSVIIPDSVTSIGEMAFYDCNNLKTVYYNGTKENWNKITIDGANSYLTSATRYYYSETEPALNSDGTAYDGNYWYYNENGEPTVWIKEN